MFIQRAAAAVFATCLALPAMAEIDRPECIAPAQPGGGFDLTCRIAQSGLKPEIKTPIEVTFMPGGIGAVAYNQFNTNRTDDGNAIVAFSSGSLLNIATGKYGEWTENDARFVGTAGTDYGAAIVREDSKFKTLKDVMDAFQADPTSVVVGAGGSVGSQDWIKAALLLKSVDIDARKIRYVAFDGGGDAIAGLLGGSIDLYMGDVGEMTSHLGANDIRVLGVLSDERLDAPFADMPTAKEQGYDAVWAILRGFYMGKNVSDEDYNTWVAAFKAAYDTPEFKQIQKEKGLLPLNLAGEELDARVKTLIASLRETAKEQGLIQ